MTAPSAKAHLAALEARRNRPPVPTTTRPGSETTELAVGDKVRANRATASTGSWSAYDGREGWVAAVNGQDLPNGVRYTEVGVSWTRPTARRNPATDVWFRTDELVRA